MGEKGVTMGKPESRLRRDPAGCVVWTVIQAGLWAYALTMILPILWTIIQSFRSGAEIVFEPWKLPNQFLWENYSDALGRLHIGTYFVNSFIVTVASMILSVLLASMVSYVLARFKFPGNRLIYYYLLASMVIPSFLLSVPVWMMIRSWGMLNNRISLILIYSAGIPWSVFILHSFFKTLPNELEDAAIVDGCSKFGVWWRVMMPMAQPGLLTVSLFSFLGHWNEYFWALIILWEKSKRTLAVGLGDLLYVQESSMDYGPLFAGFVITLIPTALIYAMFQGRLTRGITIGALKG
jgi:N-acetylglucosamine transport system permease protein